MWVSSRSAHVFLKNFALFVNVGARRRGNLLLRQFITGPFTRRFRSEENYGKLEVEERVRVYAHPIPYDSLEIILSGKLWCLY